MDFKDINTPNQLLKFMQNNLNYGFTYKNKVFLENEPNFQADFDKYYKLRSPASLIKEGYGVCWDFCELERSFFLSKKIPHDCFFIHSFKNRAEGGRTHSFLLFYKNNHCYWFEYSWANYRGIWEYNNKKEALLDITTKHKQDANSNICEIYQITKPKAELDSFEYVEHCLNCQHITKI